MGNLYKNLVATCLIILILIVPFFSSDKKDSVEPKIINDQTIGYYQSTTCNISFWEVVLKNTDNQDNLYFNSNPYPGTECYGKVTGLDKVGNKYIVSIGMNPSANFLLQSIIWLLLIVLITPGERSVKLKESLITNSIRSVILSTLFTTQYLSESRFYQRLNKYFSDDFSLDNYYLIGIFLTYFIIFLLFGDLFSNREKDLINYFPLIFLFPGTYVGLNINFYVLILSFFGLKSLIMRKYNLSFNLLYGGFSFVWIFFNRATDNFFDTDKLRGFINSSNSQESLIFWTVVFYLLINGIFHLFRVSDLDLDKIKQNFIYSGIAIVLFGLLGGNYPIINFINYFTFGQNKRGMTELTSIAGNTWRGFSASAESIGEFFAFIILFCLIYAFKNQIRLNKFEYVGFLVIGYGLYKSNNFAAISSLVLISTIFLINNLIDSKKLRLKIFITLLSVGTMGLIYLINSLDYNYLSIELLYEISLHSNFFSSMDSYTNFLSVEKYFNEEDLGTLLILDDNYYKASNSFIKLVNIYTQSINIPLVPNIIAFLSVISLLINRTEMWGIFFAKYSPSTVDAIFGSGPLQISDYLYGHKVRLDLPPEKLQSLFLPHSSIFDIFIYFGIFGSLIIVFFLFRFFYLKRYTGNNSKYLLIFLILNYAKSDSILYITSVLLIVFAIHLLNKKEVPHEKK